MKHRADSGGDEEKKRAVVPRTSYQSGPVVKFFKESGPRFRMAGFLTLQEFLNAYATCRDIREVFVNDVAASLRVKPERRNELGCVEFSVFNPILHIFSCIHQLRVDFRKWPDDPSVLIDVRANRFVYSPGSGNDAYNYTTTMTMGFADIVRAMRTKKERPLREVDVYSFSGSARVPDTAIGGPPNIRMQLVSFDGFIRYRRGGVVLLDTFEEARITHIERLIFMYPQGTAQQLQYEKDGADFMASIAKRRIRVASIEFHGICNEQFTTTASQQIGHLCTTLVIPAYPWMAELAVHYPFLGRLVVMDRYATPDDVHGLALFIKQCSRTLSLVEIGYRNLRFTDELGQAIAECRWLSRLSSGDLRGMRLPDYDVITRSCKNIETVEIGWDHASVLSTSFLTAPDRLPRMHTLELTLVELTPALENILVVHPSITRLKIQIPMTSAQQPADYLSAMIAGGRGHNLTEIKVFANSFNAVFRGPVSLITENCPRLRRIFLPLRENEVEILGALQAHYGPEFKCT